MELQKNKPLLQVKDLSISFEMYDNNLDTSLLNVISNLDISVYKGEILAIAGSSGSGKSLLAHAIFDLLPKNAIQNGKIIFEGEELTATNIKSLRGEVFSLIPQSINYLDPTMKVKKQVLGLNKNEEAIKKQEKAFERLGLNKEVEGMYPFELSGGMSRRVLFSTAIMNDSQLIVADEPTPGMSLSQAKEALSILRELADEGKAIILITHDIDLAVNFADRLSIFYTGTTVEEMPVSDFFETDERLRHPYSKALWNALPQNGLKVYDLLGQPYIKNPPIGCLFEPRCNIKTEKCKLEKPKMRKLRDGMVRCFYAT